MKTSLPSNESVYILCDSHPTPTDSASSRYRANAAPIEAAVAKAGWSVRERHPTLVNVHFLSRWLLHPGDEHAGVPAGSSEGTGLRHMLRAGLPAVCLVAEEGHAGACSFGSFGLSHLLPKVKGKKRKREKNCRATGTQSFFFCGEVK